MEEFCSKQEQYCFLKVWISSLQVFWIKMKFLILSLISLNGLLLCQSSIKEKILFPDLFTYEASNEKLTWIEAVQVR